MGIWEALEYLNTLVDDSDPDTDLSQIEHNLQTAEAIRRDGHPDWFQLTGLVHDLGKVLWLWGEPQWAVVGDTFPTGCAYSDKIVFSRVLRGESGFEESGVSDRSWASTKKGGGLDQVDMSWGHDEYFYHIAKEYLPEPALYMLRYHSFYPAHREGAYDYLMNDHDREMFEWVKTFNPYDLYSKSAVKAGSEGTEAVLSGADREVSSLVKFRFEENEDRSLTVAALKSCVRHGRYGVFGFRVISRTPSSRPKIRITCGPSGFGSGFTGSTGGACGNAATVIAGS